MQKKVCKDSKLSTLDLKNIMIEKNNKKKYLKYLKYFLFNLFCFGLNKSFKEKYKNLKKEIDFKRKTFNSAKYWENRYKNNGNSGMGSYNNLADFKAKVINDFISKNNIKSIVEFGVGDGNQLKLFDINEYIGVDVSKCVINRNKELFKNDKTKKFFLLKDFIAQSVDCSMSLDVVYHLIEDKVFVRHMEMLFDTATKYVIIYSSNYDCFQTAHVKHRKFTDWIENNRKNWKLKQFIKNEYPFDENNPDFTSFADFYIYESF